jgi:hypothetical protein
MTDRNATEATEERLSERCRRRADSCGCGDEEDCSHKMLGEAADALEAKDRQVAAVLKVCEDTDPSDRLDPDGDLHKMRRAILKAITAQHSTLF